MAIKRKAWRPAPPRQTKSQVPDSIKRILQEKVDETIENILKPAHIKSENDFNYLVDIYSKWNRNYFHFCVKYICPSPNAISPSFEMKSARMEYVGNDKPHISYMRHTKKWLDLYQGLSIHECLKSIAEEPCFIP